MVSIVMAASFSKFNIYWNYIVYHDLQTPFEMCLTRCPVLLFYFTVALESIPWPLLLFQFLWTRCHLLTCFLISTVSILWFFFPGKLIFLKQCWVCHCMLTYFQQGSFFLMNKSEKSIPLAWLFRSQSTREKPTFRDLSSNNFHRP